MFDDGSENYSGKKIPGLLRAYGFDSRSGDSMKSTELWMRRIRNLTGFLGMILPWIALLGAFIYTKVNGTPENFWDQLSISETYYLSPALAGILTAASIVLMCYDGYDWRDNLVTTLTGICGIFIVLFPCKCPISPEKVGMFQLEAGISHLIHTIAALAFFVLLAINAAFLFTLGESDTKNKRIRKLIYRICAIGMLGVFVLYPIPFWFTAKYYVIEAIALTFFGICWLVKGQVFGILKD